MGHAGVEERLRWAEGIAAEVGEMLLKSFRTGVASQRKDRGIVTELDLRAERLISDSLSHAFPGDGLVAEEGTDREATSGWRWVVDPLDGTTNYVAGLPMFAVSLACMDPGCDRAAVGVVHAPALGETFSAVRTPAPPTPRGTEEPEDGHIGRAVFILNKAYHPAAMLWEVAADLLNAIRAFRTFGCVSLDLALVSAGRAEGLVLLPADRWDIAAGLLLAAEAGIEVGDLSGGSNLGGRQGILATAPGLFAVAAGLLHSGPIRRLTG